MILANLVVVCQYFPASFDLDLAETADCGIPTRILATRLSLRQIRDLTETAVITEDLLVARPYFFDADDGQELVAVSTECSLEELCRQEKCRELACRSERSATTGDVQGAIYAYSPVLGQI